MTIGPPTALGEFEHFFARAEAAASRQNRDLRAGVDDIRRGLHRPPAEAADRRRVQVRAVLRDVGAGSLLVVTCPVLDVLRDRDVRDGATGSAVLIASSTTLYNVRRSHHALVVGGDVHEQLVEIDVLLIMRADQIVERVPRDRQHGLAVALRVVETVQAVDASRSGCREAHAQPTGVFRVSARRERGGFLVSHLDEADLVLMTAERFEDPVYAVAGNPKMTSTPQSIKRSTNRSATVFAMPFLQPGSGQLRDRALLFSC